MGQKAKTIFYIEKVPGDLNKGLGWIKIDLEVARHLSIPHLYTETSLIYSSEADCCPIKVEDKTPYFQLSNSSQDFVRLPRIRGSGNKFVLHDNGEKIALYAQKSISQKAICEWIKIWASPQAKLITPGGKTINLERVSTPKNAYVYFILNRDSSAIKIGMATDVEKRLQSLQTSSPALLELLKKIQLSNFEEAQKFERLLHDKFSHLRLNGEWFKVSEELTSYIKNCPLFYRQEINFFEPKPYRSVRLSEL